MKRAGTDDALRCSFCHKSQDIVVKLISSPSDFPRAYICNECVSVCHSIIADDNPDLRDHPQRPGRVTPRLVEAVRLWITATADSEAQRLEQLRGVVERIFGGTDRQEALVLPAGNELDALVQSRVFASARPVDSTIPAYSGDIAAAWRIVDKLAPLFGGHSAGDGWFFLQFAEHADHGESNAETLCDTSLRGECPAVPKDWSAHFHLNYVRSGLNGSAIPAHWGNLDRFCARGETAPLAICRAALKAYL